MLHKYTNGEIEVENGIHYVLMYSVASYACEKTIKISVLIAVTFTAWLYFKLVNAVDTNFG